MDLEETDQLQLLNELNLSQNVIWSSFDLTQLNVAAIGNKTPLLHIHIVGRKSIDTAWPNTVWDHSEKLPYTPKQKEINIQLLRAAFKELAISS
jgi:diadenosine tetraphosphate (Ap4A) HIT family hydrolase